MEVIILQRLCRHSFASFPHRWIWSWETSLRPSVVGRSIALRKYVDNMACVFPVRRKSHMIKNKEFEERPPSCNCWQERGNNWQRQHQVRLLLDVVFLPSRTWTICLFRRKEKESIISWRNLLQRNLSVVLIWAQTHQVVTAGMTTAALQQLRPRKKHRIHYELDKLHSIRIEKCWHYRTHLAKSETVQINNKRFPSTYKHVWPIFFYRENWKIG